MVDTRDLLIENVHAQGTPINFTLKPADKNLGAALHINVGTDIKQVTIEYETMPSASGVQWLTPAQTAGKKHPFFIHSSPSGARKKLHSFTRFAAGARDL